jgi:hypothetical protein
MDVAAVRARLRAGVDKAGGPRAFAERHGISPSLVRYTLTGKREPAGKILAALNLVRVVTYRKASAE